MELSDTAGVLRAIAIAEASDEALDVDSVILIGMHADMPARAQATVLTRPGPRRLKAPTMRQVGV
jgi:hypothetical protein